MNTAANTTEEGLAARRVATAETRAAAAARKLRYSCYVLTVVRREVGARTDVDLLRRVYALVQGARRREAGAILGFGAGFAAGVVYILASLWWLA